MLMGRVTKHVKQQNWTAVILDLLVVIFGIVIAMKAADYADEWNERKLLVVKLEMLVEESHAAKMALSSPQELLVQIITNAGKLNTYMQTCQSNNDVNGLLDELANFNSMEETSILNTQEITEHYSLLSLGFIKSLRRYNTESKSLLNHSMANLNLWRDLSILKSPYVGIATNDTKLYLIPSFESLCNDPAFKKLINFPRGIAQIELGLQGQMIKEIDSFVQNL
jgi:hypothetical protein